MVMTSPDVPKKMKPISAKIPHWQSEKVDGICKMNNISRSDFVRIAISEAIDRYSNEPHKEYPELTTESVIARFELCPVIMSLRKARRPGEDAIRILEGRG